MRPLNRRIKLIVEEIEGDTLTPISIYQRLRKKEIFT